MSWEGTIARMLKLIEKEDYIEYAPIMQLTKWIVPENKPEGYDQYVVEHHNGISIVVDRLTKASHRLAIKITFTIELADLYNQEIVRLPGVRLSIIWDHDTKLTLKFWSEFKHL